MRLTKLGHACVRIEHDGSTLVIDPGVAPFADALAALDGADGVLVTHQHADHLDVAAVQQACSANPNLWVVVPHDTVDALELAGQQVRGVGVGEDFEVAGFAVATVGGRHATIHPDLPAPPDNIGYVIGGGAVYHPGDAFASAEVAIDTLLVPLHAPWSKLSEVVDFVRAVTPQRAFAVHDGLLNEQGLGLVGGHIGKLGRTDYERLAPGQSVEI